MPQTVAGHVHRAGQNESEGPLAEPQVAAPTAAVGPDVERAAARVDRQLPERLAVGSWCRIEEADRANLVTTHISNDRVQSSVVGGPSRGRIGLINAANLQDRLP